MATEPAEYGILTPPKSMVPNGWAIILGRVLVAPLPTSKAAGEEIFCRKRNLHCFARSEEVKINRFTGEHPPPENIAERRWLSRTFAARHEAFMRLGREADMLTVDSDKEE